MTEPVDDRQLERLFEEARAGEPAALDDAFLARLMHDAAAEMPRRWGAAAGAGLWALLGGWAGAGGLAAAAVGGLWIGIAPPEGLSDLAAGLVGETASVALVPADDLFGLEG
ncbi:hypothetical protein OG2516_15204 [Oceanicola granulosus HTCC2516]|uniref:Dihydroorotate dehydrogenase n=1 Tax=Oceanicola granulosus (strain ATCC BAA-861 / DSM 15982 / KCTC 12143 / HTCC2516) TaxID=314256 RepID=Q2C9S4_OCEGH|nr:hypothetical protein [Oceanicola granulosus]EAR49426.1 hypothetical protein OG2516_15204 [Oceanicola granulosus HTCC2516]